MIESFIAAGAAGKERVTDDAERDRCDRRAEYRADSTHGRLRKRDRQECQGDPPVTANAGKTMAARLARMMTPSTAPGGTPIGAEQSFSQDEIVIRAVAITRL